MIPTKIYAGRNTYGLSRLVYSYRLLSFIFILILTNLIQKIKIEFVFFLDFCCVGFYF